MTNDLTADTKHPVLLTNPAINPIVGKLSALLAVACVAAHIPLLLTHLTDFPVIAALMTVVGCACIPCAGRLWREPSTHDAATAGALAGLMLILHLYLIMTMGGVSANGTAPIPAGMRRHVAAATMTHVAPHSMNEPLHVLTYVTAGLASAQVAISIAAIGAGTHRRAIRWRS